MVLDYVQSQGKVEIVAKKEFDPEEVLGASPEDLAKQMQEEAAAKVTRR